MSSIAASLDKLKNASHHPATGWAILFFSFVLTGTGWYVSNKFVQQKLEDRFVFWSEEIALMIRNRMHEYEEVLLGGVGLFSVVDEVSRKQWSVYTQTLKIDRHFPGIQGLGFSQSIAPWQLRAHEQKIRSEGFPDYAVKPVGPRETYTSIIYLEPFDERNRRAFGFDMFSNPVRREAMERARDTGLASISGKVTLLQEKETDVQAGFLMYVPVYNLNMPTNTPEERKTALRGFVYAPFRIKDLMKGILGSSDTGLDFEVFDGEKPDPDTLLYDADEVFHYVDKNYQSKFSRTSKLSIGGHVWTLYFTSKPSVSASLTDNLQTYLIAIGGLIIDLLLFHIIASIAAAHKKSASLAQSMGEELRNQNALSKLIVDNIGEGLIVADRNGRFVLFNSAAEKIIGKGTAEARTEQWPEAYGLFRSDGLTPYPYDELPLVRAIRGEETIGTEIFVRNENVKDGAFILATGTPLRDDKYELKGGLVIFHDITERKRLEMTVSSNETRYRAVLENVLDSIITIDRSGTILSYNPASERIFQYREDEVRGCNVNVLMPEPFRSEHDSHLKRYFNTGMTKILGLTREILCQRKDGSTFPAELTVTKFVVEEDILFTGIIRDITERKRLERMKNEFISTVSHELRTPLTSIRGSLGIILGGVTGAISDQAKSMMEIAYRNCERLVRLINDILDVEKIESGKIVLNLKPLELSALMRQALEVNRSYAEQLGIRLMLEDGASDARINVDEDRFAQIMANLISNACKFSPKGESVTVSTARLQGSIRISVRDRGPGIPESFRSKIFQKFSQADASDGRQKGGTGLGLSISKALIEGFGGRIGFDTKSGEGTLFYFDLPEWRKN